MAEEASVHLEAHGSYIAQAAYGGTAIVNVFQQAAPRPVDKDELAAALELLAAMLVDGVLTLARLHQEFMPANGYVPNGKHHEIYLSDPRRVASEKLKTVLRQPVRRG